MTELWTVTIDKDGEDLETSLHASEAAAHNWLGREFFTTSTGDEDTPAFDDLAKLHGNDARVFIEEYLARKDDMSSRFRVQRLELLKPAEPPAIHCPLCTDGELHSYSDMTENRAVLGMTEPDKHGFTDYRLSVESDLNYSGDGDGIRCNSCDEEFYRDDVVAIINGTFDAEVR